ncbi:HXXEE domain-containing protein [Thalassotalea sp. PS06]|uniref:HXXEE domain-containing protein n=1 Tax=Thalassotalea sp. PS06 TaxID=2594005 RepID=UPI00163D83A6|nr:HXXEE domain-containing protein [Thalassotalea sp. PS06]
MNKINFQNALLLAPLAYAIHHAEEHFLFNFREWRLQYFADNNPLPTELVFMILTAITLIYLFIHSVAQSKASACSVILFLMATQVVNAFFHLGSSIIFWHFSPGMITGLLLYLPVNILIAIHALKENWLTPRLLGVLFIAGICIFGLFELLGPAPMLFVLIATFIWIALANNRKTGRETHG